MINFNASENFPLHLEEVEQLWRETKRVRNFPDEAVNIKCVSEEDVRTLNKQYRHKDALTNVLTFSYDNEHDIALCLPVAEQEAKERGVELRDYVALLLVHAFLHVTGMDHERSEEEARRTKYEEQNILAEAGFAADSLGD